MSIAEKFVGMEWGAAPEDPKEVLVWLDAHARKFGHFIGGAWAAPADGKYFESADPSTGERLAEVAQGSGTDVDAAVKAARAALAGWQKVGGHARARYLYAIARLVQKHSRRLAVLETLDNGKPIRESRDLDIPLAARHFYHHAGWAQILDEEFPGYVACGVVGQIIPWNFPLLMLAWKIAPAVAAGNTVVLKPAEFTPLTALAFAEICVEAGLPAGVVNIVTGDGETGEALAMHPDVDKIAFTGSTEVGRVRFEGLHGFESQEALQLELGWEITVCDLWGRGSRQRGGGIGRRDLAESGTSLLCGIATVGAGERFPDALLEKVRRRMSTLRVGAPLDKAIDVGAIVARVQLERIQRLVEQGKAEGATCWQPEGFALPSKGFYFPPTLLSGVHPASVVAQQEIFGPVLAAMTFRTPREAVELANNTTYGLAASVWSESVNVALQTAAQVKAGVVWVNSTNLFDAACGFGGYRESGYGREGGREGMLEYLEPEWFAKAPATKAASAAEAAETNERAGSKANGHGDALSIDRTVKLYIGGKQARPDSGYSVEVRGADGRLLGEAPLGNRKRHSKRGGGGAEGTGLVEDDGAYPRANFVLHRGEFFATKCGDRRAARACRWGCAGAARGRSRDRAGVRLRGVGGQV